MPLNSSLNFGKLVTERERQGEREREREIIIGRGGERDNNRERERGREREGDNNREREREREIIIGREREEERWTRKKDVFPIERTEIKGLVNERTAIGNGQGCTMLCIFRFLLHCLMWYISCFFSTFKYKDSQLKDTF